MHLRETLPRFTFSLFIIFIITIAGSETLLVWAPVCCTDLFVPHPLTHVRGKAGLLCHVMGLILQNDGFCLLLGSFAFHCFSWSPLGWKGLALGRVRLRSASLRAERCPANATLEGEIQRYTTEACLTYLLREKNFLFWHLSDATSCISFSVMFFDEPLCPAY